MKQIAIIFLTYLPMTLFAQMAKPSIGLANGEVIYANHVRYKAPLFGRGYIVLNDDERYELDEVAYYENWKGFYRNLGGGTVNPPGFYRRIVAGSRVEAYTKTVYFSPPSVFVGSGFGLQLPSLNVRRYDYYDKDEQGPLSLSYNNLKVDLADNVMSMATLQQVKNLRVVTGAVYVAGAGLLIAGIAQTFGQSPDQGQNASVSPLLIAGAVTLTIPVFLHIAKRNKMIEALLFYNRP